jgi:hypothetical protein
MKLTIPDVPPSLNALPRHWGDKARLNSYWRSLVRSVLLPESWPKGKQRVTVTLCHGRKYDECDNLQGACKPIFDALKHWKLIVDDSPQWLEAHVSQEKCKHRERHTIIEIEAA